jgi:trehalose utilization protein
MRQPATRRDLLRTATAAAAAQAMARRDAAAGTPGGQSDAGAAPESIKVVVWDEEQPAQKQAYENFLGNQIANHLGEQPGISVRSVKLDDPERGLSASVLDGCRVLIWWGHVRQGEVAPDAGRRIVERIKNGELSLIALHSAHWSMPFVEAMNERARMDAVRRFGLEGATNVELREIPPPRRYTVPKAGDRPSPYASARKYPAGKSVVTLQLPYCCFPAYRSDGKPSQVRVLKPGHPIVAGIPAVFEISKTEMYDEPFHVPEPDEVILEERWAGGEWFRSGSVWKLGKGRVFYFRPGHETFPVFKQAEPLRILTNAVRWLAVPGG